MPPTVVELVQLCLVLISIPIYFWFLFTIIRFRKKKPFDSSFFTLCLALGVCDMQCLLTNWVLGKLPMFGWFGLDVLVENYSRNMAKICAFFAVSGYLQQFTGVALMAFNRCTALAYFHKHKQIWTSTFLRRALVFQFVAPVVAFLPAVLIPESFEYSVNNETGDIGPVVFRYKKLQFAVGMGVSGYIWSMNILCAILYGISFWKVKSINITVHPVGRSGRNNSVSGHKREVRLSIIGFILSALMTVYAVLMFQAATADPEYWEFIMLAWGVVNDVASWSNPWLCFIFSPTIRKHMIAMIRGKANELLATRRNTPRANEV